MNDIFKNNPPILNNFLNYLLGIQNYSKKTVKAYNSSLNVFFQFIITYMNLNIDIKKINTLILLQVKRNDIIAFLVYCNFSKNNSPATRQCKLAAIKTFYIWLLSTTPGGYLKINPASDLPKIEKVERQPKYLNLEQAKKIQDIFTLENSRNAIRDNAIISTFLSTGARVSELVNANLKNVNFRKNTIIVIGKGNKERTLYLNSTSKEKLLKYIKRRKKKNKVINLNEPLFLNKNGRRLGVDGVEDICAKAFKLIGLENCGYTTHTLRHTAATLLYLQTQDILTVKEFLEHESIETSEIYTHVSKEKLKQAINKNPLNFENNEDREEEVA